ncbi:MAG: hypothetical protein LW821_03185 [Flammeovirgaceae bacterium]|jgi:hypothetical protein|nr:hypothetical protein [Flammeovirgaceae bacterium]
MNLLLSILLFSVSTLQIVPTFKSIQSKDSNFISEVDDGLAEVLPGCSWYCGGFVSGFNSSSVLPNYKDISYSSEKAHDFDISTAWIEGKSDYGIGEFIEYSFDMSEVKQHQLGITKLIVANGYKKNRKTWQENARVKKMKLYVDNRLFGYVELIDSFEFQTVEINKIMLPKEKVMKLRFEIIDVYPGTKYKDTAISELLFDGVGVH